MLRPPSETPAEIVDLDDRMLLPRHARGDAEAFAVLVQRYRRSVYGYLVRTSVPVADRDDLFQEIFCRVHAAAGQYEPDRPLRPWIFAIAVNTTRSYFRKRTIRAGTEVRDDLDGTAAAGSHPGEMLEANETACWIEAEIARLPDEQRDVVLLCCVEQLDRASAAEALGIPTNTVKTHLRRARLAMGRSLARRRLRADREVNR